MNFHININHLLYISVGDSIGKRYKKTKTSALDSKILAWSSTLLSLEFNALALKIFWSSTALGG